MVKNMPKIAVTGVFAILWPFTGTKTLLNHFDLVEEVLSFNLVDHMWKSVRSWLQERVESDATLKKLKP